MAARLTVREWTYSQVLQGVSRPGSCLIFSKVLCTCLYVAPEPLGGEAASDSGFLWGAKQGEITGHILPGGLSHLVLAT